MNDGKKSFILLTSVCCATSIAYRSSVLRFCKYTVQSSAFTWQSKVVPMCRVATEIWRKITSRRPILHKRCDFLAFDSKASLLVQDLTKTANNIEEELMSFSRCSPVVRVPTYLQQYNQWYHARQAACTRVKVISPRRLCPRVTYFIFRS